jgi:hypothetical protein
MLKLFLIVMRIQPAPLVFPLIHFLAAIIKSPEARLYKTARIDIYRFLYRPNSSRLLATFWKNTHQAVVGAADQVALVKACRIFFE